MNTQSRYIHSLFLLMVGLMMSAYAMAQDITSVHGTVSDEFGPLMGATVCEIDGSGRIIESAITDMNGMFTMKVRNAKDRIRFSYVGLDTQTKPLNTSTYDIKMESKTTLQEVTVKSKRRMSGNNLPIPEREVSFAVQTLSTKEFEGLGINTIDEALQGRVAGLDIVMNSGNLGSGSTMRLRGGGSLSGLTNENPLIVVDGNVRDVDMSNFDLSSSNDEKFAELLNINTEDIASISVLKDAAATAIYGSQGGNGVIELTTKRGSRGAPRVSYTAKFTGTYQPKGYEMLSGDDYTMLLKEAYFNPRQLDAASNINEINYDPTFSEYEQYNNNTDWRDAVTQWGLRQNHYITVSGGGEKATFRISAGYDHETGTMIKSKLDRLSTRTNLDYNVSERIRVQTNFALTYTKNNKQSDDLLAVALKKMPNMSIYEQDPTTGEDTDKYYNMLQTASDVFANDQRTSGTYILNSSGQVINYTNPVAYANLVKYTDATYDINPELVLKYELLGMDEGSTRLTWNGHVYMNIFNEYIDRFWPAELYTTSRSSGVNTSLNSSRKSVSLTTKHTLTFIPAFKNKDHSLLAMGRFELTTGSSNYQYTSVNGLPTGISSTFAGDLNIDPQTYYNDWKSVYFTFSTHYAYKSRYMIDVSLRADGTTKFGPDKRWGYFPAVSLRWNVIDEPFMKKVKGNWLSMLSIRPSWGMVGKAPTEDYLYTSTYASAYQYLDMTAMYPQNLKLSNLSWEKTEQYNLGFDFGFLNDKITASFEIYNMTTTDNLMSNYRIPSSTGYAYLAYRNDGKKRDTGWEFRINTNKLIKKGKFSMDFNVNFANNHSEVLEMDENILKSINSTFNNENAQVLTRLQINNPFGSIYGFKYKGVYQYNYETLENYNLVMQRKAQSGEIDHWTTEDYRNYIQSQLDAGLTYPVATNADGQVIMDGDGNPIRQKFAYSNGTDGKNYSFNGGDAIYEDVNHDGQINALDIQYLGSSLPTLNGGFGFNFNYGDWRLSTQFNYRVGNDILNMARLSAEAMVNNDNQSQAVNYRWRKEGDVTSIPRAMYGSETNYNTLVSDRFVEDGSYLRISYIQLSYAFKKKMLKGTGLNKLSFYISANNPFCFTSYTGVDPDVSYSGYAPATDNSQTPRSKSYTFGLSVEF